jgi:hypothetical protein
VPGASYVIPLPPPRGSADHEIWPIQDRTREAPTSGRGNSGRTRSKIRVSAQEMLLAMQKHGNRGDPIDSAECRVDDLAAILRQPTTALLQGRR